MRIHRGWLVVAALIAATVTARSAAADNNPNGIVFRAVGWFRGKAEITAGQIKCEIPTVSGAIADGAFSMGLWNSYGSQTLFFPDTSNPFGNPCGGWLQLQNNMRDQAINLDHVRMQFKIPGARRFRQFVETRKNFPLACNDLRKDTLYVGTRLNGTASTQETSSSGAPNVAFLQMLPVISPQLLSCLRSQYAGLSTDVYTSLPLVVRAVAVGVSDAGETYKSNPVSYTLTLRHTCGNGRIDDGEFCDPTAPSTCFGICEGLDPTDPNSTGNCSQSDELACRSDADCQGVCQGQGNPTECVCVY